MNSVRQTSKIAILTAIAITLTVAITARGQLQSFSLYSASNTILTSTPLSLTNSEPAINSVLPVIAMTNVPLSQGIHRLMRRSRMQATIDWHLTDWWAMTDANGHHIHDPMLNFRWTNMTASDALFRLLREHHLTWELEPVSLGAWITYDHGFSDYKSPVTNAIHSIEFVDVPITVGLENLAYKGRLNYMFDPELRYGDTDRYGKIIREPQVTLTLSNTTPEDAFNRICANCGLVTVPDPRTGVILVRHKGHDVDIVNPDVYANDTNVIPLIKFEDLPLSVALEKLAQQAEIKCILSPRIDTGHVETEPCVNIRWQNITGGQAFAAVCESYDLDITKYPISGIIRVEPKY